MKIKYGVLRLCVGGFENESRDRFVGGIDEGEVNFLKSLAVES